MKAVPQEHVSELWKNYQTYSEKFYDIIKINNQFRDYDFEKNLEMKTALCETVEKLQTEPDVISAFHQLQKLHQQWREIGPVAKRTARRLYWSRIQSRFHNHQQTPSGAFRRIESEGTGKPGSQDSHLRTDRKHRFPGFEIIQRLGRKK